MEEIEGGWREVEGGGKRAGFVKSFPVVRGKKPSFHLSFAASTVDLRAMTGPSHLPLVGGSTAPLWSNSTNTSGLRHRGRHNINESMRQQKLVERLPLTFFFPPLFYEAEEDVQF
jgi:hypothetical protein